jgi:type II secretory pathway pseudopilin PulG
LVVISIIALIASSAIYAFNKARMQARDAKRMADMVQLETALRLYFQDNGSFPPNTDNDASGWDCGGSSYDTVFIQPLATGNYIKPVPTELKKGMGCTYKYYNYGGRVILGVRLEAPQTVPDRCDNYQTWVANNYWYCVDLMKDN